MPAAYSYNLARTISTYSNFCVFIQFVGLIIATNYHALLDDVVTFYFILVCILFFAKKLFFKVVTLTVQSLSYILGTHYTSQGNRITKMACINEVLFIDFRRGVPESLT